MLITDIILSLEADLPYLLHTTVTVAHVGQTGLKVFV